MPRPAVALVFSKVGSLKTDEELKDLQKLLRQLRCLWSFGKWQDAQVLRTWSEELRVLKPEEFVQLEEPGQLEEFASRALKVKHLAYAQASLT